MLSTNRRGLLASVSYTALFAALFAQPAALSQFAIFQVAATAAGTGFTQITPTAPSGQGSGFNGAGSRLIYVSFSTGLDTNTGTLASPVKTKAHALTLMRNGSPDQMLCLCGDTWPATDTFQIPAAGGGATPVGAVGGSITGPWLFGFYGSGARPMMQCDHTTGNIIGFHIGNQSNIAVIGWEAYAPGRDPTVSTYNFTDANSSPSLLSSAQNAAGDWLLIEDCRTSYLNTAIICEAAASTAGTDAQGNKIYTAPFGRLWIRRCLIHKSYGLSGGANFSGDTHGIFLASIGSPVIDGCAVAYGGWESVLTVPKTATASGNTFTWPIAGYAFNALPFGNGATLRVNATGGGLSAGTPYFVINANSVAGTFQLSTTVGGSAAAVTNGSYTLMWADPALTFLNHNLYLDVTCTTNNAVITNNIWLYSSNTMVRTGGVFQGNYVAYNSLFGPYLGVQNGEGDPNITTCQKISMSGNVIQHPGNTISGGQFSATEGGVGCDLENVNGNAGSASITSNIFSMSTQVTPQSTGIVNFCNDGNSDVVKNISATGNIFYNWNDNNTSNDLSFAGVFNNYANTGTGLTVSPNTIDGVSTYPATNAESYPHPLRDLATYDTDMLGGPGTVADAISQIIGATPGGGRPLQTWPTNLTPQGLVSYIKAGFGM